MHATLCKRFTFDAAHCLPKLGPDHKCARLHGHTYTAELTIYGDVDPVTGFVMDYEDIAKAWQVIHDQIDHRYLNEIEGLEVPSTEVLCHWIWPRLSSAILERRGYGSCALLTQLRIYESSTTYCQIDEGDR